MACLAKAKPSMNDLVPLPARRNPKQRKYARPKINIFLGKTLLGQGYPAAQSLSVLLSVCKAAV